MEKQAINYLIDSSFVLVEKKNYIIIPVLLISSLYCSIFISNELLPLYNLSIMIALLIVIPIFYGQFVEILVSGKTNDWKDVLKKYWFKFVCISFLLKMPIITIRLMFKDIGILEEIFSLAISLLTIYVLPVVFLQEAILPSIKLALKCLIGNAKFSAPFLIVLIAFSIFCHTITAFAHHVDFQFISYGTSIFLILVSTFVDFWIFVSATMVIIDKFALKKTV